MSRKEKTGKRKSGQPIEFPVCPTDISGTTPDISGTTPDNVKIPDSTEITTENVKINKKKVTFAVKDDIVEIFDEVEEPEVAQPSSNSSSDEENEPIIIEADIHPQSSHSSSEKFQEPNEKSSQKLIESTDSQVKSKELENAAPETTELSAIDERDFFQFKLAGQTLSALCDQGSQKSYINEKFTEKYKDRLQPHNSLNLGAFEGQSAIQITGKIKVALSVGTTTSDFELRVSPDLRYDVILGKDFLVKYDIDVRNRAGLWRCGRKGKWCRFQNGENQTSSTTFAECAGLVEI